MRIAERIALAYFVYLLIAIAVSPIHPWRRAALGAVVLGLLAVVFAASALPDSGGWRLVRDWAPGVYVLAGYRLPGWLVTVPNEALEQRLLSIDRWLLSLPIPRDAIPGTLRAYLELTYLFCYPLVPVSLALVYFPAVDTLRAGVADRFWSVVLLAVYPCYGLLPWVQTRPPRALAVGPPPLSDISAIRRLNLRVLHRASVGVNTFPSGHVAATTAAALAVSEWWPAAGLLVGVLAASIAWAAVLGRYHYLLDVVLGAACAIAAWLSLTAIRPASAEHRVPPVTPIVALDWNRPIRRAAPGAALCRPWSWEGSL